MKRIPWGYELQLDLINCNPESIRNEEIIKNYVNELCNLIEMTPYGATQLVRFGKDPSVTGYSMTQLIEESLISGHFIENIDSVCLNIFSCKPFNTGETIKFSKEYFDAEECESLYADRMNHCGRKRLT